MRRTLRWEVAEDFIHRWQHFGLRLATNDWVWVERCGDHDNNEIMKDKEYAKYYGGGGAFNRVLDMRYQRASWKLGCR